MCRTCATWFSTVRSDSTRRRAMAAFVTPSVTSAATSRSREVRPASPSGPPSMPRPWSGRGRAKTASPGLRRPLPARPYPWCLPRTSGRERGGWAPCRWRRHWRASHADRGRVRPSCQPCVGPAPVRHGVPCRPLRLGVHATAVGGSEFAFNTPYCAWAAVPFLRTATVSKSSASPRQPDAVRVHDRVGVGTDRAPGPCLPH